MPPGVRGPHREVNWANRAFVHQIAVAMTTERGQLSRDRGWAPLHPRLAVIEENWVRSKEKGHVSVSFSRLFARGEPRGTTDYMLRTMPDDLAFRKATNAKPSKPVPRSRRLLGSGATVVSNVKLMLPAWVTDSDQ